MSRETVRRPRRGLNERDPRVRRPCTRISGNRTITLCKSRSFGAVTLSHTRGSVAAAAAAHAAIESGARGENAAKAVYRETARRGHVAGRR